MLKAKREGIAFRNPFESIQVRMIRGNRTYLNAEELRRLMQYYGSADCVGVRKQTLRAFLFSATTGGIRISDILNLTQKNLKDDIIEFVPEKTKKINKKINIPVLPESKLFISNHPHFLLGELPDQVTMNRELKKIALATRINKKLSFHVSRDTFATVLRKFTLK